jgi:phosphoglucosamine mutase
LFGTDGVRGIAYEPPLDRATVVRIGFALAQNLGGSAPRILIGRDTRRSGPDLERWLMSGLVKGNAAPESAGVIPTPAVAFLTRSEAFDAGVVLSASHNPYRDNGIKLFTGGGAKASAELEARIEELVRDSGGGDDLPDDTGDVEGSLSDPDPRFEELYLDHLLSTLPAEARGKLPKLEIVLDCENGAGYRVGPRLLRELGLVVHPLCAEPNGENINDGCGSTHMEVVSSAVVERGCDLGAALDGDGDRLLMVDSTGRVIDGDALLLLCARRLKKEREVRGVVATVMSNMALEQALAAEGLPLYRVPVGDKFVTREMAERNIPLGGEQSGHIVFQDHGSTGDGLLTLLQVLRVLALESRSLDELGRLDPFPQVMVNVRVRERPDVKEVPALARAIEEAERRLSGRGRVLIRYSGTEPLLRIMMEGPERGEIEALARTIEDAARATIGAAP